MGHRAHPTFPARLKNPASQRHGQMTCAGPIRPGITLSRCRAFYELRNATGRLHNLEVYCSEAAMSLQGYTVDKRMDPSHKWHMREFNTLCRLRSGTLPLALALARALPRRLLLLLLLPLPLPPRRRLLLCAGKRGPICEQACRENLVMLRWHASLAAPGEGQDCACSLGNLGRESTRWGRGPPSLQSCTTCTT